MLDLLKFEIGSQLKTRYFWLIFFLFLFIGFAPTSFNLLTADASELRANINGAQAVSGLFIPFIQISIFLGAFLSVAITLKDDLNEFTDMVHVTSVTTPYLLAMRFSSVLALSFLWLCGGTLGLFLAQFSPFIPVEHIGKPNVLFYLHPLIFYAGISVLIMTAIYTAIAWSFRSQMAVYITAIAAFVVINIAQAMGSIAQFETVSQIIDFTGSSAQGGVVEYWSTPEQEKTVTPILSAFGLNRLVWFCLSMAAILVSGLFYKRRDFVRRRKTRKTRSSAKEMDTKISAAIPTLSPAPRSMAMFKTWFKFELLAAIKSWPYLALHLLALLSFTTMVFLRSEFHPVPLLPTSNQIVILALNGFSLCLILAVVFFSASITWRDKTAGLKEVLDVTPSEDIVHMSVKWAVMMTLMLMLLLAAGVFTVIAQLALGNPTIEFKAIFAQLFLNVGLLIGFFTILTLFLQTIVQNQKTGLLISAGCAVFLFFIIKQLPFYHPLIDFGRTSFGSYSDMNGFEGQSWIKGGWLALYWGLISITLGALTLRLWPRGLTLKAKDRWKNSGHRANSLTSYAAIGGALGACLVGGFIFFHLNIKNDYDTAKDTERKFVTYEKLFGNQFDAPHPIITDMKLHYDMFPKQQRGRITGQYTLRNQTNAPITDIVIAVPAKNNKNIIKLDVRGATLDTTHKFYTELQDYQYRPYTFTVPLAPNQTTKLIFDIIQPAPSIGEPSLIRKNGTFLIGQRILPQLGFEHARITNNKKRKKYGLEPHPELKNRTDIHAIHQPFYRTIANRISYEASLCTAPEQIAMTPGTLIREYEHKGRRCFDYKSENPILPHLNFVSGQYQVYQDKQGNVDFSIYFHPRHKYNISTMMDSMKGSLALFEKKFGPYQFDHFRVLEFPYGRKAESFAGTVSFSENVGFIMDIDGAATSNNGLDFVSYVTAHELAHQWFGHQVVGARVKGHTTLSESITEHAASESVEELRGWLMAKRFRDRALELYLAGRTESWEKEPPLALAEREAHIFYQKGHLAFWAIKHAIGKDAVNAAIKDFVDSKNDGLAPYATTRDLIDALKAHAPMKFHRLIEDYFERLVIWDLSIEGTPLVIENDGRFDLEMGINADRLLVDPDTSKQTRSDLNEHLEIGFYETESSLEPFHIVTVNITQNQTSQRVTLSQLPKLIKLDPRGIFIEKNGRDNISVIDVIN